MEEERNAKSANPSIDDQVGHRIGTAAWLSTNLGSIGDSPDLPAQSESNAYPLSFLRFSDWIFHVQHHHSALSYRQPAWMEGDGVV
jgi:hypothetical protein